MIALEIGSSAAREREKKTGTNKIKSILQHLNDNEIANTLLPILLAEFFIIRWRFAFAFRSRFFLLTFYPEGETQCFRTSFSQDIAFFSFFQSFFWKLQAVFSIRNDPIWSIGNGFGMVQFTDKHKTQNSFKFVVIYLKESHSEFIVRQFSWMPFGRDGLNWLALFVFLIQY